jgi:hypothetical protein
MVLYLVEGKVLRIDVPGRKRYAELLLSPRISPLADILDFFGEIIAINRSHSLVKAKFMYRRAAFAKENASDYHINFLNLVRIAISTFIVAYHKVRKYRHVFYV